MIECATYVASSGAASYSEQIHFDELMVGTAFGADSGDHRLIRQLTFEELRQALRMRGVR